jgi:hypothetical protein
VIRPPLDLLDLREVEFRLRADLFRVRFRDVAVLRLRFTSERLDFEPNLVFALVSPDGGHLRKRVSGDHEGAEDANLRGSGKILCATG